MIRRLVLDGADLARERLDLPPAAVRYVVRVLRSRAGDRLLLLDGAGGRAEAVIERLAPAAVTVRLAPPAAAEAENAAGPHAPHAPPLHLVQALPKGTKLDEIVRRATELGVTSLRPCLSSRSVARPGSERAAVRLERWRRIAVEASRQCRRDVLPAIHDLVPLADALRAAPAGTVRVILHDGASSRDLGAALASAGDEGATVAIGPEGGFADHEVEDAARVGFVPASLGPLVLRTETAAIAVVAVAQYALGALGPGRREG
jgi:16S rRNA (uracil1498-N3)-methyltransferase